MSNVSKESGARVGRTFKMIEKIENNVLSNASSKVTGRLVDLFKYVVTATKLGHQVDFTANNLTFINV